MFTPKIPLNITPKHPESKNVGKKVILIVDDQPQDRDLLEAILIPQGYEVIKVSSGKQALEMVRTRNLDLILMDVRMPEIDGFSLTAKIRKKTPHQQLPIILVTALMEREDKIKGIEVGCDGFVTKPVDKVELLARVDSLLKTKSYSDLMTVYQKELESEVSRRTEELRNLSAHLLHAREEERKLIAREIHDELGQILAALKIDLQWIEKKFIQNPDAAIKKIHDVVALADKTIDMVHRLASELRPGVLDDLGLGAAIEWLGGDFLQKYNVPCWVDFTATESRMGSKSSTAVFRIVQEALTNISRHAQASSAFVEVWEEEETVFLRIRDDGVGITPEQSASITAYGLIGIRERVLGLKGTMVISGNPDTGTTLLIMIPFPPDGDLP